MKIHILLWFWSQNSNIVFYEKCCSYLSTSIFNNMNFLGSQRCSIGVSKEKACGTYPSAQRPITGKDTKKIRKCCVHRLYARFSGSTDIYKPIRIFNYRIWRVMLTRLEREQCLLMFYWTDKGLSWVCKYNIVCN